MMSLFCAMTAWAQISAGSVYSIQNKNSKRAISQNASMELAVVDVAKDNAQLWLVEEGEAEGTIRLRNIASGAYAQCKKQTYEIWNTDFITTDFYVGEMSAADGETPAYYYISHTAIADKTAQSYTVMHESGAKVVQWEQTNNNSQWSFVEVSDVDIDAEEWKAMSETKAYAKSKIESLKLATILFPVNAELGEIEAVNAENSDVASLKNAADAINSILSTIYAKADGKSVVFDNNGGDGRAGLSVTAMDDGKAYGTASEGDETIWTLKHQGYGKYKLYNFIRNKYLNTPGTANLTDEAGAANYEFIVVDENKVALVDGTKMLHQATYWAPNYTLLDWNDLNDAASLWTITEKEIEISRELYDLANEAKTALPYAIQQAYGLVTDANNYYSNYKSTAEGSYEALLDNVEGSYFHSAYNDEPGDGSNVHYIQANLGDGNSVDEFYFYMKPRSGNGNNRPVDIIVAGSNDNVEYTKIADVTTTLDGTMTPYVSAKLGEAGTKYQYIRLTVTSTNTGTKFFTLSELYFFPATNDVENLVNAYSGLATTSITSEDYAKHANALIKAETTLALANIKKEIAAILTTNATNHAEEPALGQYTTAAYNALVEAGTTAKTVADIENAILAFRKAKNCPVFTIDGGSKDYAVGKSIYDNNSGTLYFKHTDNNDKTMLWMFDQTAKTVGVTESVAVVNMATGNGFWGAEALKITETSDAVDGEDDGLFLFYTVGNETPVHFQDNNQQIVRYGSTEANSGSAVKFTYVGNSYDINNGYTLTTSEETRGWSTLMLGYNVVIPEGVKAYTIAAVDGSVELEEVTGVLGANTPILVNAASGEYTLEYTSDAATIVPTTDYLKGTLVDKVLTEKVYILSVVNDVVGFYVAKQTDGKFTAKANKAYMVLPAEASNVSFYGFRGEEGTTGVENVEIRNEKEEIFDLAGRRVNEITEKGIYIINGQKVVK